MQENGLRVIDQLQRSSNMIHSPKTGWLVLVVSMALTFMAYWIASRQVQIRAEEQFLFRAEEITHAIYERMSIYEQTLQGAAGLFRSSREVTREDWQSYVSALDLSNRLPGIQGLGYSLVVADRDTTISSIRSQGFPEFSIRPEGERDFYTTIVYLEPFDWRNQRAFGYDMWSNGLRQKAMARAIDEGGLATSALITLVQETEKDVQRGFLTYMPVYKTKVIPSTIAERRAQIQGWVYAAFRAGDLMQGILGAKDTDIGFELYDGASREEASLLFSSSTELNIYPDKADASGLSLKKTMVLQGQEWNVYFRATKDMLLSRSEAEQPTYILIAGLFIDGLLFYVILSLHFVNRRINSASKQLTQEFEVNQQSLRLQTRLIEATERESETFFQMAPEAFLVVSQKGVIVRANKYAHQLFEYGDRELLGLSLEMLVPNEIKKMHANMRAEYFAQPVSREMAGNRNLTAQKKGGDEFSVTVSLEPIELKGEAHVVAAVHDVSAQKRLERTLAEAKEKAESASRSKSDFVANMSHEIRTPLNAVIGAAQLLDKTSPNAVQVKYINMIRSSGEALLGVINDILDFSKIEAGCMELSAISFHLPDVLSRVALMMSLNAGEKDIELVIHVDLDVCCQLVGDPLRLQQVLINLASNAIKFTDQGTVVLSVNSLSTDDGIQKVKFSMSDTGIGMDKVQQSRLFNAFSQADESITRRFGGTGLGLIISNKIVELMGTQIRVSSTIGRGTVFSFTVELPIDESVSPRRDWLNDTEYKVLVIDDSPDTCSAIKEILGSLGLRSWVYSSWSEAQVELSGTPLIQELDFVILDWQLDLDVRGQKISAMEVIQKLRGMGLKDSCASVLASSNNACASLLMDCEQKEFDAGLVKPILKRALMDSLHEASLNKTGVGVGALGQQEVESAGRVSGVTVLLVEDNVFNQAIAQGLLEDMGARFKIANNGSEAIELYKSDPDAFDMILMDIQMPVMDGLTATKILRHELDCRLPIIAMTAGVLRSEQDKYLNAGMDDFVAKPIDQKELFRVIHSGMLSGQYEVESPKSVKTVTKPPLEAHLVFNSKRLELLSKGKSNRVKSIIDCIDSLSANGGSSLMAGWQAIKDETRDQAHILFHGFKGQVANYGGEALAFSIQSLEQGLRDDLAVEELQPLFNLVMQGYRDYVSLAQVWKEEQKKLFDEE